MGARCPWGSTRPRKRSSPSSARRVEFTRASGYPYYRSKFPTRSGTGPGMGLATPSPVMRQCWSMAPHRPLYRDAWPSVWRFCFRRSARCPQSGAPAEQAPGAPRVVSPQWMDVPELRPTVGVRSGSTASSYYPSCPPGSGPQEDPSKNDATQASARPEPRRRPRMDMKHPGLMLVAAMVGGLVGGAVTSRLALGTAAVCAQPTSAPEKVIRAEKFEVLDAGGKVRATLTSQGDEGPTLRLLDTDGEDRVVLSLHPTDEAVLAFRDK